MGSLHWLLPSSLYTYYEIFACTFVLWDDHYLLCTLIPTYTCCALNACVYKVISTYEFYKIQHICSVVNDEESMSRNSLPFLHIPNFAQLAILEAGLLNFISLFELVKETYKYTTGASVILKILCQSAVCF